MKGTNLYFPNNTTRKGDADLEKASARSTEANIGGNSVEKYQKSTDPLFPNSYPSKAGTVLALFLLVGCHKANHFTTLPSLLIPKECVTKEVLLTDCDVKSNPTKCKYSVISYSAGCEKRERCIRDSRGRLVNWELEERRTDIRMSLVQIL